MDIHRCGDCQKEFDSFETFLIHKLLFEQYELVIEPSERIPGLRIPKFIKPIQDCTINKDKQSKPPAQNSVDIANIADKTDLSGNSTVAKTSENLRPPESEHNQVIQPSKAVIPRSPETADEESRLPSDPEARELDDDDDNISVWSQTESLRIDESAIGKDNFSSPLRDSQTDVEKKSKHQFHCKHCNRYYTNKVVLRVHQETVHGSVKRHVCTTCKQTFKTKGSLVRHTRTHTGERPFCCQECGRTFYDSGTLCRHVNKLHHCEKSSKRPRVVQVLIARLAPETCNPDPSHDSKNS